MKKILYVLIVILITISLMVDTYYTMENYWTKTCTNPNCTVCNKE